MCDSFLDDLLVAESHPEHIVWELETFYEIYAYQAQVLTKTDLKNERQEINALNLLVFILFFFLLPT